MSLRNDGLFNDGAAITPGDTTQHNVHGLYIGGAGDVAVKGRSGNAFTFKAVPAGTFIPMVVSTVMATGTTATNILGLTP